MSSAIVAYRCLYRITQHKAGCAARAQSLNRYSYCRNNPHKYTDPNGRIFNVVVGALAGGGFNLAFYFFELTVTGEKFNANKALAVTISDAFTGAVAGATFGLSVPIARAKTK